ncbi:Pkinase-fungal domain-containing protein [Mycena indigotica]|uniref:Pkinase-fungal domain-containing protein n=1 Tax=Mycena indigotica TaxID=2126181 RepID=A0A8H6SY59_9AGAR|nr:Pkinase-fungal domain-containing protein [Mycena indigotica]KAF7307448.1 Pkinase-fungal domain-containing protein [Mycena indigotica]
MDSLESYQAHVAAQRQKFLDVLPSRSAPGLEPVTQLETQEDAAMLDIDPYALDSRKTLERISVTGALVGITDTRLEALRDHDETICRRYFHGRVLSSPFESILRKLGGESFIGRFDELKAQAESGVDVALRGAVVKAYNSESTNSTEALRVNEHYWLSALAMVAIPSIAETSNTVMDFFRTQNHGEQQLDYRKQRQFDAALRPRAATNTTFHNVLVNIEYTTVAAPQIDTNPLIGSTRGVGKYQHAILNAVKIRLTQNTRLYVPTLSFHGKGEETKLFLSILNQDRLEFAVIDDCFGSALPTVAALLWLFQSASPYELGLNPLFSYKFTSLPEEYQPGDAVPAAAHLPDHPPIQLTGNYLSPLRFGLFDRSTVILEGVHDDESAFRFVVKLTFISDARVWREKIILDHLFSARSDPPAYTPELVASFAAVGPPFTVLPDSQPQHPKYPLTLMRPHHMEVMAFKSPRDTKKLKELSVPQLIATAIHLFESLLDMFSRRIMHLDISSGNVLSTSQQALLIDWELGRIFGAPLPAEGSPVIGTLDTMAVYPLQGGDLLPHDDLESAVYVLLKAVTQTFVPTQKQGEWVRFRDAYGWDRGDESPYTRSYLRLTLWGKQFPFGLREKTMTFFRDSGDELRAAFVEALFSMALPAGRWNPATSRESKGSNLDVTDYNEVFASLKEIVEGVVVKLKALKSLHVPQHRYLAHILADNNTTHAVFCSDVMYGFVQVGVVLLLL